MRQATPVVSTIDKLVLPEAGQSLDGDSLRNLRKPGVYVLMKGATVLYVGMGKSIMARLAGLGHLQSGRAIAECDKALMYPCISIEAAIELETIQIARLQPQHNYNRMWEDKLKRLGLDGNRNLARARYDLPTREDLKS